MLWLLVFLVVAVAIQARQAAAVLTAGRVARPNEPPWSARSDWPPVAKSSEIEPNVS
jgi:hypothetical protein